MRHWGLAVAATLAVLAAACGEPEPDIDLPAREDGQLVADLAGVLDEDDVAAAFAELAAQGWDAAALTFETPQANMGEAQRAGRELVDAWGVDVVVVAVARPGDFESDEPDRRRAVGVEAPSARAVPGSLREDVANEAMGPHAEENAWSEAFVDAAEWLADGLGPGGP